MSAKSIQIEDGLTRNIAEVTANRELRVLGSFTAPAGGLEVIQDTHDDLNCNANIQVGDADVSGANPVPVSLALSSIEVTQDTHDDLNANANIQVGNADVSGANPVPVSLALSSIEVTQATHDDLNCNANIQQGDADVGPANALSVQPGTGACFLVDNCPGETVDVSVIGAVTATVSGTVAVSNFPASQTIDGSVGITGDVEVVQPTHDDLNANANMQVGDVDVSGANPVPVSPGTGAVFPVSDNGSSLTVDGTVDVGNFPASQTVDDGGSSLSVDDGGGSLTVDGSVAVSGITGDVEVVQADAADLQMTANQALHDNLNANANVQQGNADVGAANKLHVQSNDADDFLVTASGTVGVNGVVPGTAATQLGKAEDAPHTSGDVGVMMLGIRTDGATNLSSDDLDYTPFAVDKVGRQYVIVTEGVVQANVAVGGALVGAANPVPVAETNIQNDSNSTTTPLGVSGVFTGTGRLMDEFSSVKVEVFADQPSDLSPLGLRLEWSQDNTNWDIVESYEIAASTAKAITSPVRGRYFRVVYHNNFSVAQTVFRLQTVLHPKALSTNLFVSGREIEDTNDLGMPVKNAGNSSLDVTQAASDVFDTTEQELIDVGVALAIDHKLMMAGFERDDNLSNGYDVGANSSAQVARLDSRGALWVREAQNKMELSGSTDGRPIAIAATGSPGTTIHTADASATDFIFLTLTNTSAAERKVTLQIGGTATSDQLVLRIPAEDTRVVLVEQPLTNSLLLRAFCDTANVVNATGYVRRDP